MDIVIGKISPFGKESSPRKYGSKRADGIRFKDRRHSTYDRRKDVRNGIVLTLSNGNRSPQDRRAHP